MECFFFTTFAHMNSQELSILIPTYNHVCTSLIEALHGQASRLPVRFEIVVAEDGSTDKTAIGTNHRLVQLPGVRHLVMKENVGRAAIRNFLVAQAHYARVILLDADLFIPNDDFLLRYLETKGDVVVGGYSVKGCDPAICHGLRYHYERACEQAHPLEKRQREPYLRFSTSCFMAQRKVMCSHPFDTRFRHYGYEDVAFGMQLQKSGTCIVHIDNPVGTCHFEDNSTFLDKAEEALRTLYAFRQELTGYSALLSLTMRLQRLHLLPIVRVFHALTKGSMRKILEHHDSVLLFQGYRLCYLASLFA